MHPDTKENLNRLEAQKLPVIRSEDLLFVTRHRVLADVAADLCLALPPNHGFRACVLVGIHRFGRLPELVGPRLGIQTEQLLDTHGKTMWHNYPIERIRRDVLYCDGLLEFSFANLPVYSGLRPKRREKVLFGPYVFPDHEIQVRPEGEYIAFVGNTHGRRREILAALSETYPIEIAPRGTFGTNLAAWLARSSGVLNIHFADGSYAELPRILKAYLAGKILYSEELSYPFVADRHYLPLGALEQPAEKRVQLFEGFRREIAMPFRFTRFLETFLQRTPERPDILSD